MRVVFMGTPDFAVPSLRALADSHDVVAVYTQPDRARGRGRDLKPSAVKLAAVELGIPVVQPQGLKEPETIDALVQLAPEVIVVAAYGAILPPAVLEIPLHGCINVHASLLPRYRGAAPVHHAVLNGDEFTGVSIMQMEEGLDTGAYATVRRIPVGSSSVPELTERLAELGAEALLEALAEIESGEVEWTVQDESQVTYASKIAAKDVSILPSMTVQEALRRVRASTPSARSRICIGDRVVEVTEAALSDADLPAGTVDAGKNHLCVGLADGAISLAEVKPAGKAAMDGACFARGARIPDECTWDCA